MPPPPSDQASETNGSVHPLLSSFAHETRALLFRLLAYLSIPIVLVLIGMELWSASSANLAELIDSAAKTIAAKEAGNAEAPSRQVSSGTSDGDRAPVASTASDRAASPQPAATPAPAPAQRDQMRRQRLLEPTKNRTDAPCQELSQQKQLPKAERGRCDRSAAVVGGADMDGAPPTARLHLDRSAGLAL